MKDATAVTTGHVAVRLLLAGLVSVGLFSIPGYVAAKTESANSGNRVQECSSDSGGAAATALPLLDSPDAETRRRAVEMLANIGSEDAAKVLLTMLADTDAGVRQSARNALVHVKAQALDGAVIAVLLAGDRHLLTGVDEALPLLRETLEPGMLARLTGERASSMECAAAAYALGRMKSKVATPILAEYAKTDKALVAVTCAHALYSIGDEGSLRELAGLIDSSYVEVRRAAVYGLVRIGGPEVLEKLTAVASGKTETNLGLRQEAVMLLGYVGDWSTVDLLINLIKQQAGLGRAAAHALERLTGLSVGDRPYLWTDWYNEIVAQQKAAEEPPPPLVPAQARQGAVPGLPPEGFPFIP